MKTEPSAQVTERADNRVGRGVVNHREDCTRCQRARASIDKAKRRADVNGHAESGSVRRCNSPPLQHAFVSREGVEDESTVNGEDAGGGRTVAG